MITKYLKPYLLCIIFIVLLTFGQVIADLLLPNFMAHIVDDGIAKSNTDLIFHKGGIMLLIALAGVCCAVVAGYLASRSALGMGRNLRTALFSHISKYSLAEFDKLGTSSLITRTTNDVQQIQTTTFMILRMMLRAPIMCIGGIIMAVGKDKDLSLLLLGILPFIALIIFIVMKKAVPLFRTIQKKVDHLNLVLRENLVGIRIVRAFSRVGYEKRRFAAANADLTDTSIRVNRLMAILNPSMNFSMNLLAIAIIWVASFRIDTGDLLVGDMMAFIQYAMQIFMSLMMLSMMFILLPRAYASAERIREVFNLKADIENPEHSDKITENKGVITFKNVSFRYNNAENPAVNNISFTALPGETLAIIGGTGSGKTALVNLILRYYDVESGAILFDGIDIRHLKQEDLRSRIGFVPQKATIFSGTVNENIRMGKQNATEEEVVHACRIAQADGFIRQLPENYETVIAQGGTDLSGGQKQRLSIARAVIRKPQIYIFDDSFSALDFKTDSAVRSALKKETGNSTVIVIAQRVTSIRHADKILVMDKGNLIGMGTHEDLLQSNEIYREIVSSQLSDDEILDA